MPDVRLALILASVAAIAFAQDRTLSSEANVQAVAFARDGKTLTGMCADGKLRQWDLQSGAVRKTVAWEKDESIAAFPPEGDLYATTRTGGIITLWDLET